MNKPERDKCCMISLIRKIQKSRYLKWVNNRVLLCSTGSSAQGHVAAWVRGESGGEHRELCSGHGAAWVRGESGGEHRELCSGHGAAWGFIYLEVSGLPGPGCLFPSPYEGNFQPLRLQIFFLVLSLIFQRFYMQISFCLMLSQRSLMVSTFYLFFSFAAPSG